MKHYLTFAYVQSFLLAYKNVKIAKSIITEPLFHVSETVKNALEVQKCYLFFLDIN